MRFNMKTLFSISILLFLLSSCTENSNILSPEEADIFRQVAYNSLNERSKESIIGDWQSAPVNSGRYHSDRNSNLIIIDSERSIPFILKDKQTELNEDQVLVAVTFNTTDDPLLGPITTIIDRNSRTIIGWVGRL